MLNFRSFVEDSSLLNMKINNSKGKSKFWKFKWEKFSSEIGNQDEKILTPFQIFICKNEELNIIRLSIKYINILNFLDSRRRFVNQFVPFYVFCVCLFKHSDISFIIKAAFLKTKFECFKWFVLLSHFSQKILGHLKKTLLLCHFLIGVTLVNFPPFSPFRFSFIRLSAHKHTTSVFPFSFFFFFLFF